MDKKKTVKSPHKAAAQKKVKRPRKADKQYVQELTVKSVLHNIRLAKGAVVDDVNLCTELAAEFIVTIHDIYRDYSNYLEKKELTGAQKLDRREHLVINCLKKAGKNVALNKDSDLAQLLGITTGMVSSSHLMHEERRASIVALCHMFLALDWMQSGLMPADDTDTKAAHRKVAHRKVTQLKDAQLKVTQRKFAQWKANLRKAAAVRKAKRRKAAVREPRKRFVSYTVQNDVEPSTLIRDAAKPFGYWLPTQEDDWARDVLIQSVVRDGTALMQLEIPPSEDATPKEDKPKEDQPEKKLDYPLDLERYVWLTPQKLNTLYDPQGAWSHDANKLHMIIAACKKDYSAQEIEQAYHAFGLHPQGLCDPKNGNLELYKRPDFPADQVVLASILYFSDLIQCVKCYDFPTRMAAFWGLLFAQLNDYDEGAFRKTKLGLRDQLFFDEKTPGGVYDPKRKTQKKFHNPLYDYEYTFAEVEFLPNNPKGETP